MRYFPGDIVRYHGPDLDYETLRASGYIQASMGPFMLTSGTKGKVVRGHNTISAGILNLHTVSKLVWVYWPEKQATCAVFGGNLRQILPSALFKVKEVFSV